MAAHPAESLDADLDAEPGVGAKVLRGFVVSAVSLAPGPELLAALLALTARDDLTAREWVEITSGWKKVTCLAAAGQFVAIGALDQALTGGTDGDGFAGPGRTCPVRRTADELAPALAMAPRAASSLVSLVRRCEELPVAMDALADGLIDLPQLRVLDAHARHLPPGPRRELEAAAVRWAPARTRQQLDAALAAEAIRLDPVHASDMIEHGVSERDVQSRPSPRAGCRRLVADLPTDHAHAAWLALNGAARTARRGATQRGDDRTLAQLRADLLTAVLTGQHTAPGEDPDQQVDAQVEGQVGGQVVVPSPAELSRHVEVHVVVAADTLTGHNDLPASIPGVGPIDPDTARDLATGQPWRRLIADPTTGTLQHVDPHTLPPPRQAEPPDPDHPDDPDPDPDDPDGDDDPDDADDPDDGDDPDGDDPDPAAPPATQRDHSPADPSQTGKREAPEQTTGLLASDPRLARLLTEPVTPAQLDYGTNTYRTPAALTRHVHTRDATCIGPACHHPATGTETDHTINYRETGPDGQVGKTSHTNIGSTCERIHNAKTHGGWTLSQPTPGTFTWTSPTGRTYTRTVRPLIHGWNDATPADSH